MAEQTVTSTSIRRKLNEYLRILKLTRKPTKEEFSMIAKVAGLGILVMGLVGFIIYMTLTELPKYMAG
ncbi:MAG: protein translocase SEC61 complex subunit gamma [Methanosarcinales archaeon]|nr:protein translocase SEC61 complex subunit gamma [Methanosarcinales archaeon]